MSNVLIVPEVDASLAKKQTQEWVQQSVSEFEKAATGANKVQKGLDGIAAASNKTADAVKKIDFKQGLDRAVSKFGDVKDILDKTGVSLLGFSESTSKSIGSVAELAQKGASLGALFGPIGIGIGALAGGIAGYFAAASNEAAEAEKKLQGLQSEVKESMSKFRDFNNIDLSALVTELEQVRKKQQEIKELTKQTGNLFVPDFSDTNAIVASLSKIRQITTDEENQLQTTIKETQSALTESGKKQSEAYLSAEKNAVKLQNRLRDLRIEAATIEQTPEALADFNKRFEAATKESDKAEASLRKLTDTIISSNVPVKAAKKEIDSLKDTTSDYSNELNKTAKTLREQADASYQSYLMDKLKKDASGDIIKRLEIERKGIEAIANAQKKIEVEAQKSPLDILSGKLIELTGVSTTAGKTISDEMGKVGNSIASSLAGTASQAFDSFLDVLAGAEEKGSKAAGKLARALVRQIGTSLVADGTANVLKGAALTLLSQPQGPALAAVGAAEIAAGASMGASAALRQKRKGDFQEKDSAPGGSGSSGGSSSLITGSNPTQNLTPIVIHFNSVVPANEREAQRIGEQLNSYLSAGKRAGRN